MTTRTAMARISALRPTQLTLGLDHVEEKMRVTQQHADEGAVLGAGHNPARPLVPRNPDLGADSGVRQFMRKHPIRTIVGPGHALFIVDHHHWARAWTELDIDEAPVEIVADLHAMDSWSFWRRMRKLGHVHLYDHNGRWQSLAALPEHVREMHDDPYRSLAAFARNAGAYRKPRNAEGDFAWAGFFRKQVVEDLKSPAGFARGLARAIRIARSPVARELPGYRGPGAGFKRASAAPPGHRWGTPLDLKSNQLTAGDDDER